MKLSKVLLGLTPVLLVIVVSSFYQEVEGQQVGQNPWANYQKYGRRLSNRNRGNRNRNQQSHARAARRKSVPATIQGRGRESKNLRNTFPFNDAATAGRQQQPRQNHRNTAANRRGNSRGVASASVQRFNPPALDNRASRQRGGGGDDVAIDKGSIFAAGERCIDKVVTVQETEYDDVITCKHSYSQKCHVTYSTDYSPTQEEECEENFKKRCFIEYKNVASEETVQFCFTPLVRNCDIPGPTECTTEYTSQCVTRYNEHDVQDDVPDCVDEIEEKCESKTQGYSTSEECTKWPVRKCNLQSQNIKKYSPETNCKKVPFELCGPGACPVEPGPEECQERKQTVVQEVPQETCTLEPQRECKHVTKLVPKLKARENCLDIPKEVCSRSRTNPRKVDKPVIKKWCYTSKGPTKKPREGGGGGNGNQGNGGTRRPTNGGTDTKKGCVSGYPADHCPNKRRNGVCDEECNTRRCGNDGGDCKKKPPVTRRTTEKPITPKGCNPRYPPSHCPNKRNDGTCDKECNNKACGYDGRDCKKKPTGGYLPPSKGYE